MTLIQYLYEPNGNQIHLELEYAYTLSFIAVSKDGTRYELTPTVLDIPTSEVSVDLSSLSAGSYHYQFHLTYVKGKKTTRISTKIYHFRILETSPDE